MTNAALAGVGVLVTRPRLQAGGLIKAIENEGGKAVCLPVIEIVPRDQSLVEASLSELPEPDIVIFVSSNAVEHGLRYVSNAKIGAIGPATAAAVQAAGRIVDICPEQGFDSESLLLEPELRDVAGKQILIVRGNGGRALLARTLRSRGAVINYLSVYDRLLPKTSPELLDRVETMWRRGEISVITVMSVDSLHNLITLLPDWCRAQLESIPLVTPAARVLKEAHDLYPDSTPKLAATPAADAMVEAIISLQRTDPG